jgi:hypothetical protein
LKIPVFKDNIIEKSFQKEGYVVLSLLSRSEVKTLLDFYDANPNEVNDGFHATHFSKNRPYKKLVHQKIVATYEVGLTNLLNNYNLLFANFMVKETGNNSVMPLHADWTYVDEKQFQSLGIWSPLVDTNEQNGMLGVIPSSHKLKVNNRGPKIISPFIENNDYIIENYGKLLKVDAGSVVIYDHRLLHYSPANLSNHKRVSVNISATPNDAEISHYSYFEKPNKVHKYEVLGADFFLEYNHFEEPDNGKIVDEYELNLLPFEKKYLDSILSSKSTLHKIKSLFKLN